MRRLTKFIDKLHTPKWLFFLLCAVLVLRIPSFFEPYSYGDEMIYLTLGEAIRRGVPLYKGVYDNKPPLLYIIAAISGSLFWFKAILAIWHLITIFIFWKLTELIFEKNKKAQIVATIIFAVLTTIPTLEGNIANAEIFMIGPTILAFLILLSKNLNPKKIFLGGMLFSLATLFKVPAALEIGAIMFLWFIALKNYDRKNLTGLIKNTLYLLIGFATPIILAFLLYFLRGALNEYVVAAFLQNLGYLSSWRPGDVQKPFLIKNLPFILRASVVAAGLGIVAWKRKKLSSPFLFSCVWLLISLFAVTLSERPYPHYMLQAIPSISLLLSILFTRENREQTLAIIPLTIAFIVPVVFKFWYYPTFPYYLRFAKFASGQITRVEYLLTFGSHVPRNYKIADFVIASTKPNDKIFVWGESSPIYALTKRFPPGKYVADYHIKDFSTPVETLRIISSDEPEFIIILPEASDFPQLTSYVRKNYGLVENIEGAEVWKLLSSRVRALLSP